MCDCAQFYVRELYSTSTMRRGSSTLQRRLVTCPSLFPFPLYSISSLYPPPSPPIIPASPLLHLLSLYPSSPPPSILPFLQIIPASPLSILPPLPLPPSPPPYSYMYLLCFLLSSCFFSSPFLPTLLLPLIPSPPILPALLLLLSLPSFPSTVECCPQQHPPHSNGGTPTSREAAAGGVLPVVGPGGGA